MTERGKDRHRVTRRAALTGTALALGAAAATTVIRQADAQAKLSQSAAKYQGTPNGKDSCETCTNFRPPSACTFVQGEISPNGWCQLFTAKSS